MIRFANIDGQVLHYAFHVGDVSKPAVIFANSLGTDLRIWDDVLAHLPSGTPALLVDKRGHGLSPCGVTSIPELASDMAHLMDRHDLRGAVGCGVSVGGEIMQSLAATRPDLIGAMVLCCTASKIGTAAEWDSRIALVRQHGLSHIADAVMERWFSPEFTVLNPDALTGYKTMFNRTDPAGYTDVCAAIRDCDLTDAASSLMQPTHCVAGADDLATPPPVVQALAQAMPNGTFEVLQKVGHLPCIEAPAAVARAIIRQMEML